MPFLTAHAKFLAGLAFFCVLLSLHCGSTPAERIQRIERGRLACSELVQRKQVNNYWWELEFENRPFIPDGFKTNKVGGCRASRNPEAQVFVALLHDDIWRFQLNHDKPIFVPIPRVNGLGSIQQFKQGVFSGGGRYLVWSNQVTILETGATIQFPAIEGDMIGISPDLKTVIVRGEDRPAHNTLTLKMIDITTSRGIERILNRGKNLWLLDYTSGEEAIEEQLRWEKDSAGRYVLSYPAR